MDQDVVFFARLREDLSLDKKLSIIHFLGSFTVDPVLQKCLEVFHRYCGYLP